MIQMTESTATRGRTTTIEPAQRQEDRARAAGRGASLMTELRRMAYFRDLFLQGFESTIWQDRAVPSLRDERLALGIELPELDTVALWSTRCGGDLVSIPFTEFILGRIRESAARFAPVDHDGEIGDGIDQLDAILAWITPAGGDVTSLPRLGDVYLPESEAARLSAPGGLLDRVLDSCRAGALRLPHAAAR